MRSQQEWLQVFIEKSRTLEEELKKAASLQSPGYQNSDIALRNVSKWHELAVSGQLIGAYSPNFGISKSDLMFGKAEPKMYELEDLYCSYLQGS
jgi:hypothetical protein